MAAPTTESQVVEKLPILQKLAYDVDLLFVIDNSPSMSATQTNVRENFPALMQVLKDLPSGLPNVHIGVVTTDLGAGPVTTLQGCKPYGDRGTMRATPGVTPGKSPTPLDCKGVNEGNFIVALNNGSESNFDGDIADVFSCIAAVGERGCGFEQSLLAPAVALGYWGGIPENQGFLRKDALLAIVLLTDEDDCSVPPDSLLFDPNQNGLASELGPLQNFRCNEFGHLCSGQAPPRVGSEPVSLNADECHSNEEGRLVPVAEIANYLKSLKADPNQVFVAAITGKPTQYGISYTNPENTATTEKWPEIQPTCQNPTSPTVVAYPAVRIRDFVAQFGGNGVIESICDGSFKPALNRIGVDLSVRLNPGCLKKRPTKAVSCTVTDYVPDGTGKYTSQVVPRCNDGDAMAVDTTRTCWYLTANDKCASQLEMKVNRVQDIPGGTYAELQCVACQAGAEDCL